MKLIFRFLDADKLRRFRIIKQGEIGQHLQGTIGGEFCQNRSLERRILDLKQKPAVLHGFRFYILQAGHPGRKGFQDVIKLIRFLFLEILNDIGKIIADG